MNRTVALIATGCLALFGPAWAQQRADGVELDADRNGLYDDAERKVMLDVIQQNVPSLKGTTFDADGDGKVTVLEQAQGRRPLTMTIGQELLASGAAMPWAIDAFPEWISLAYLQEDAPAGEVPEIVSRGLYAHLAKPTKAGRLPRKAATGSGIAFAANSGQQLVLPGNGHARWDYRWCVFTFRIDAGIGNDVETLLVDMNSGEGSGRSSPMIWYHADKGLHVQYVGTNQDGLDKRVMVASNVVADGKTWNVLVCGMRYGQMFASVNGVELRTEAPQPPRFSCEKPEGELKATLGDAGQGGMAWGLDALIFGLSEPSEAMVRKMTGWAAHRLNVQQNLPADHPYRNTRPVIDAEDFPARFVMDEEAWNAVGAKAKDKAITRVNAGGERIDPKMLGFERVFYDDFRNYRLAPSASGEGDLWHGPGWNPAVAGDAIMIEPGKAPNAYPYDKQNQKQTLSLVPQGDRWRCSAIYSINDMGHGYAWKGTKVFRLRCMFPKTDPKDLAGGNFQGFWSYDNDFLFWRTANRIEVDYFETEGQDGRWLNSFSSHYHYSHFRKNNIHNPKPEGYKRFKPHGALLTEENSKIPGGFYFWDGQYHTWEVVIDKEMTYFNVTIPGADGKERWVEIFRTPTAPTYLQNLDVQITQGLRKRYGLPKHQEDMVLDFVEVLQKPEDIQRLPPLFTSRPKLTGATTAGSTVTCEANVPGVTDLRYFWFADGYPLTWGPGSTYTITEAEAGKEIRCMIKAVGALDQPEAWSDPIR